MRNIEPPAITFGDLITLRGDFYASQFNETDSDEDFYTRILIGGRGCDSRTENGTGYVSEGVKTMSAFIWSGIDRVGGEWQGYLCAWSNVDAGVHNESG